jgi:hypothetical protein
MIKPWNTKLADHFTLGELVPTDRQGFKAQSHVAQVALLMRLTKLAETLEVVRVETGHPLYVNSGFRSPAYNAKVGGSPTSSHMTGHAADVHSKHLSPKALASLVMALDREKHISIDQCILYPRWVHIGIGTRKRHQFFEVMK